MQTVSVDTVVATAASTLPYVSDEDRLLMREWAYLAVREIGPTEIDRVTDYKVPVNDFIAFKPEDAIFVEDLSFLDGDLGEIGYILDGKGGPIHSHSGESWNYIHVSEYPTYYALSSNAGNVRWAKMTYLGLPVDEDGMPKIPERATFAVALFLRYMWYMRQGQESVASNLEASWLRQKIRTTASMKTPDKVNFIELARNWKSMIDLAIGKSKYRN